MRFANQILLIILSLPATVYPQAQQAAGDLPPPSIGEMFTQMIPLFIAVFLIFYLMVVKPQEKKLRAQQSLLQSLKRGDEVVSSGGIIGRVAGIEKDHILVETAGSAKLKFEPSHIIKRFEPESAQTSKS